VTPGRRSQAADDDRCRYPGGEPGEIAHGRARRGPLQDFYLIEQMANFNRERIPMWRHPSAKLLFSAGTAC
jgi:hypothetical protein